MQLPLPLLSLRKYCCLSRFFLAVLGFAALLHVLVFTSACLLNAPWLPSIGRLCSLVGFARSSSSLYWLAWRSLTPSCQVWLAAAPCHLCPCLVSPTAAANGRSWALSSWISYPGLVLVKNLLSQWPNILVACAPGLAFRK